MYNIGELRYTSQAINVSVVVLIVILCLVLVFIAILLVVMKRKKIGPFRKRSDLNVNYSAGQEVTSIEDYSSGQRMYNLRNGKLGLLFCVCNIFIPLRQSRKNLLLDEI